MENRYVQQFKKGSLEMILLCLIARKETYGYEIITELQHRQRRCFRLCQGGNRLSHPLPDAGIWSHQMPNSPCHS